MPEDWRCFDGISSRTMKKTPCFYHSLETQTGVGTMLTPDELLVEPRRNIDTSMVGFFLTPP
jgi:hypothetical protein